MKFKQPDEYKVGEIIIPAQAIDNRLGEIAQELSKKYRKKHLLLIGLLLGAAWVTIDILERLYSLGISDIELAFMKVSSYPKGTTASFEPNIQYDKNLNFQKRSILLVDDIVDTGKTLKAVTTLLKNEEAETIESLVLLDKPTRREVMYTPAYCCFTIPDIWVQGRGMDSDGYGRGDSNIRKGPYYF